MSNSKKTENEPQKEYDPALDVYSEHFDPLKALYSDKFVVPCKNAKVYDNLSQFESKVMRPRPAGNEATTSKQSQNSATISSNTRTNTTKASKFSVSDEPVVRRFLPHQRKAF